MPSIKDVAQAAGVSTASVSRVFADHPSVSQDLKKRVQQAATALNYRPSALGRALRTKGSKTIGLIVSDIVNPFFAQLARSVEDAARQAGYFMIIGNADENPDQQDHYVRILLEQQVDGLIVVPTIETSQLLQEAVKVGSHIVLVDRPAEATAAPLVASKVDKAMKELVTHLVQTGRKDIGFIAGPKAAGSARTRLNAFKNASKDAGVNWEKNRIYNGDFRVQSGNEIMNRILESNDRPQALIIANGQMTLGALEALRTWGKKNPTVQIEAEMALASVDDLPAFELLDPDITAIEQPTEQLGHAAFAMLMDLMGGKKVESKELECQLILRASTARRKTKTAPENDLATNQLGRKR